MSRLNDLESAVLLSERSYIAAGRALMLIRDDRLYPDSDFGAYVERRFDMTRRHAYRLIEASQAAEYLKDAEQPLPANISQARVFQAVANNIGLHEAIEMWSVVCDQCRKSDWSIGGPKFATVLRAHAHSVGASLSSLSGGPGPAAHKKASDRARGHAAVVERAHEMVAAAGVDARLVRIQELLGKGMYAAAREEFESLLLHYQRAKSERLSRLESAV